MIDPQARPAHYFRLLALVTLLGLISALITFAFMAIVHQGTALVWERAATALGMDPRLHRADLHLGGLLVGLLVKPSAITPHFRRSDAGVRKNPALRYRNAPDRDHRLRVAHLRSESRPEAPLADACGGVGTWMSDRLKLDERGRAPWVIPASAGCSPPSSRRRFSGRVVGPGVGAGGTGGLSPYFWLLFPVCWRHRGYRGVRRVERLLRDDVPVPRYVPASRSGIAAPLGLIGAAAAPVHGLAEAPATPVSADEAARGAAPLLGGLGMGLIGALLPLTLFSGRRNVRPDLPRGRDRHLDAHRVGGSQAIRDLLLLATGWKGAISSLSCLPASAWGWR